jgi:hypothetical protein
MRINIAREKLKEFGMVEDGDTVFSSHISGNGCWYVLVIPAENTEIIVKRYLASSGAKYEVNEEYAGFL